MRAAVVVLLLCLGVTVECADGKAQASHILMKDEEELKKVMKEIEGGADFGEMAKKHSTCPSKDKGGDLGKFGRGSMVKEFDAVVFDPKTEVGKVYGPVKTQFGYHLIKVTERDGAGKKKKKSKKKKVSPVSVSSEAEFTDVVLKSKEAFAVEFYSKMCGSCTEFAPTWEKYASSSPPFKTTKLSIDDDWVKSLAGRIGVLEEGIPNVRLFTTTEEKGVSVVKGSTPNLKELEKQVLAAGKAGGLKKKGKKTGIYRKTTTGAEEL